MSIDKINNIQATTVGELFKAMRDANAATLRLNLSGADGKPICLIVLATGTIAETLDEFLDMPEDE